MKKSLVDYKIDDVSVEFKTLPVSKEDIETLIDITKALSSVFSSSGDLDFSFFDDKKENFKTKVGLNKDNQPVYSFIAKWYLKDSKDFLVPDKFRDNNETNDILEHVSALIFFEKIGEIDIPTQPMFQHRAGTVREYPNGPVRSTYPGISTLLRDTEIDENSEIFYFTAIAGKNTGTGVLWTLKIIIPQSLNLGRAKDAFLYFTLPNKMIDNQGIVN